MKKYERIIKHIENEKRLLLQFCNMNDSHNEYAQGKLDSMNNIIDYINKYIK